MKRAASGVISSLHCGVETMLHLSAYGHSILLLTLMAGGCQLLK